MWVLLCVCARARVRVFITFILCFCLDVCRFLLLFLLYVDLVFIVLLIF